MAIEYFDKGRSSGRQDVTELKRRILTSKDESIRIENKIKRFITRKCPKKFIYNETFENQRDVVQNMNAAGKMRKELPHLVNSWVNNHKYRQIYIYEYIQRLSAMNDNELTEEQIKDKNLYTMQNCGNYFRDNNNSQLRIRLIWGEPTWIILHCLNYYLTPSEKNYEHIIAFDSQIQNSIKKIHTRYVLNEFR